MTEEPPSTSLNIGVLTEDRLWPADLPEVEDLVRRMTMAAWTFCLAEGAPRAAAAEAIAASHATVFEVTLVLAGDPMVADLNQRYRGCSGPTNVLSFADVEAPLPVPSAGPRLLGDVVFARQTIAREAAAQGKSLADHLAHLAVHGLLHLLGYDHQTEDQADLMEGLERRILARQGLSDPYRENADGAAAKPTEAVP